MSVCRFISLFSSLAICAAVSQAQQTDVNEAPIEPESVESSSVVPSNAESADASLNEVQLDETSASDTESAINPEDAIPLEQSVKIGFRQSLESEVLEQTRDFQVYLPASYGSRTDFNYPVLYVLDGDFSFHGVTGLVEQLATVSHLTPEMIVVGISDKGTAAYRHNMKPKLPRSKGGQADKFLRFISEELKPSIETQYRTADYSILFGHSIGGLFVLNSLFEQPDSFNTYIAASPMMWWKEHKLEDKAKQAIEDSKLPERKLYLSLADEKRMGVYGLLELLDRGRPEGINWQFKAYPNENHNSVGLISLRHALRDLFKGWYLSFDQLQQYEEFSVARNHYQSILDRFGLQQQLPDFVFKALMYKYQKQGLDQQSAALYLQTRQFLPRSTVTMNLHLASLELRQKRYEKAKELLDDIALEYQELAKVHEAYGDFWLAQKKQQRAAEEYQQALDLAEAQSMRQWYRNILQGKLSSVKKNER